MKTAYFSLIFGVALTTSVKADWFQWDGILGNGHFYTVTDTAMTWYDARAEAGNQGGYLTSIGSIEELNFIRSTFGRSELFWTGLSTVNGNNVFEWDNGDPITFSYFGAHQPDPNQISSVIINSLNSRGFTRGFFLDVSPLDFHRGIIERDTDPAPVNVPDGGSTVFLLGCAALGIGLWRGRRS
jgi:hypothetical protein